MTGGYVKLFRSIEQWEWYQDTNTKVLFLHCLIRANHKPKKWRGRMIETGMFVTSYSKLADELNLSISQIRVGINHLKMTGEVTHQTTNEYSIITVAKWGDYQGGNDDDDTPNDMPKSTPIATNKKDKNKRNIRSNDKEGDDSITPYSIKLTFGEFNNVKLTADEMEKIKSSGLIDFIAKLSAYKESTGKKYRSDYATILNWSRKDGQGKRHEPIPDYQEPTKTMSEAEIEALKLRVKRNGEPK